MNSLTDIRKNHEVSSLTPVGIEPHVEFVVRLLIKSSLRVVKSSYRNKPHLDDFSRMFVSSCNKLNFRILVSSQFLIRLPRWVIC